MESEFDLNFCEFEVKGYSQGKSNVQRLQKVRIWKFG